MADITVQVSSAGLTAYGAQAYGSNTYGGDNSPVIQTQTVEAYNLSGWGGITWGYAQWGELNDVNIQLTGLSTLQTYTGNEAATPNQGYGRLTWGYLPWGQAFEDQVVQVTTPGTGTVWGSDFWGDAEWGQISGMDTDQGSVQATISVAPQLTGEQLNTTTDTAVAGASAEITLTNSNLTTTTDVTSVFGGELVVVEVTSPANDEWGTDKWSAGQWGVGDGITLFVGTETEHIADANVYPLGTQASFQAVGTVEIPVVIENGFELTLSQGDAFGGELVVVEVTTASATNWGDAPYGEGQWGQGVGTDISQGGEEIGIPSQEVPVTNTNLTLNSFANNQPYIYADANVFPTGQELTLYLGNEDAIPNTIARPSGIEIGPFTIGDFLAGISAEVSPTGVTMTPTTGIIGLNAWAVVDPGTAPTWTVVDIAA
jgi:hypothetical protein